MCLLNPAELSRPLDFHQIFGNFREVEVEIGVGKGKFLSEAAEANPATNFLGIEKSEKWIHFAASRILEKGASNIRLIRGFADRMVPEVFASESVSAIHIYFPDPWPKRRHEKRRLFQVRFFEELERILKPGGRAFVATDHLDYANWIMHTYQRSKSPQLQLEVGTARPFRTNYEIKYEREGRAIRYMEFRKRLLD